MQQALAPREWRVGQQRVFILPAAHCRDGRQETDVLAQEVTATLSWVVILLFPLPLSYREGNGCIGQHQKLNMPSVGVCRGESSSQQILLSPYYVPDTFLGMEVLKQENKKIKCLSTYNSQPCKRKGWKKHPRNSFGTPAQLQHLRPNALQHFSIKFEHFNPCSPDNNCTCLYLQLQPYCSKEKHPKPLLFTPSPGTLSDWKLLRPSDLKLTRSMSRPSHGRNWKNLELCSENDVVTHCGLPQKLSSFEMSSLPCHWGRSAGDCLGTFRLRDYSSSCKTLH